MIESNVLITPDERGIYEFDGNYTIYNPDNTTQILLVAPFYCMDDYIFANISVEINEVEADFMLDYTVFNDDTYSLLEQHLNFTDIGRQLVLCNITFDGHSNTTVRYSYTSQEWITTYSYFIYDIGTATAWNCTTVETVEFRITGSQPDSYYPEIDASNPDIINIPDGKSYKWYFWTEAQFEEYQVVWLGYFPVTETPTNESSLPLVYCFIAMVVMLPYKYKIKK